MNIYLVEVYDGIEGLIYIDSVFQSRDNADFRASQLTDGFVKDGAILYARTVKTPVEDWNGVI